VNKTQLVDAIAGATSQPKTVATEALDALLNSIKNALMQNDDVVIAGFGTFSVKERTAREGRNPKTGEKIQIAASRSPVFKAGKGFKDAINS
jgi:DNA-binding protein HU-beta